MIWKTRTQNHIQLLCIALMHQVFLNSTINKWFQNQRSIYTQEASFKN